GIDPLKICIDYNHNGVYAPIFPTNAEELASCEPVFMEMPGWTKDITGITEWRDLPKNAADYLEAIAKPYGCPIKFVGTGPERSQLIVRWT
ncbi:MAG TPA: adenylosuccinate synthetase, partial [Patescibacteria group bacterium]|nr:adenylosuccinate synthetase [Patescibacteria group bacterium]